MFNRKKEPEQILPPAPRNPLTMLERLRLRSADLDAMIEGLQKRHAIELASLHDKHQQEADSIAKEQAGLDEDIAWLRMISERHPHTEEIIRSIMARFEPKS